VKVAPSRTLAELGPTSVVVVGVLPTDCDSGADVEPLNAASPPYSAVIECAPAGKDDVVKVACPLPLSAPVPSAVAPFRNVTVPVGVPDAAVVTVAVKVAAWPTFVGFGEDVSVVLVAALTTVCDNGADVEPLNVASPPYSAVIECAPAGSDDVVSVACPAPFSAPVPSVVAPSRNVTVPVGVPDAGDVTVAVKVAVWPTLLGFGVDVSAVLVDALATVCVLPGDVEALKFASPA
jgi:hypothetical protein